MLDPYSVTSSFRMTVSLRDAVLILSIPAQKTLLVRCCACKNALKTHTGFFTNDKLEVAKQFFRLKRPFDSTYRSSDELTSPSYPSGKLSEYEPEKLKSEQLKQGESKGTAIERFPRCML